MCLDLCFAPQFCGRRGSWILFLPVVFLFSLIAAAVFSLPLSFFRAAAYLRQLSELRLLLSFFRERKRTKKAFRGGVPPPRKLPLPRLGQAASRHRSSDASVGHLKCGVRYSLQCSAQIMPEPLGCRFVSSALSRMRTACAARAAARGGYFCRILLFVCIFRSFRLFILLFAAATIYCPHRFSVQLPVCDGFLNCDYFSLSFVKEREQRKSSGEAFPLPRSCPSPGSVERHPGIGHPMPLYGT